MWDADSIITPRRRAGAAARAEGNHPRRLRAPPLVPAAVRLDHVHVRARVVEPDPEHHEVERAEDEAHDKANQAAGSRVAADLLVHVGRAESAYERPEVRPPREEAHAASMRRRRPTGK